MVRAEAKSFNACRRTDSKEANKLKAPAKSSASSNCHTLINSVDLEKEVTKHARSRNRGQKSIFYLLHSF